MCYAQQLIKLEHIKIGLIIDTFRSSIFVFIIFASPRTIKIKYPPNILKKFLWTPMTLSLSVFVSLHLSFCVRFHASLCPAHTNPFVFPYHPLCQLPCLSTHLL